MLYKSLAKGGSCSIESLPLENISLLEDRLFTDISIFEGGAVKFILDIETRFFSVKFLDSREAAHEPAV